jgi:hypothetical protein
MSLLEPLYTRRPWRVFVMMFLVTFVLGTIFSVILCLSGGFDNVGKCMGISIGVSAGAALLVGIFSAWAVSTNNLRRD